MNDFFKNKTFVALVIALFLLIIASVIYLVLNVKEPIAMKEQEKIDKVEVNEVTVLYNTLSNVDCNNIIAFDFSDKNIIYANDIPNDIKIKFVLSLLNTNDLLNESLTNNLFNSYSKKMFGPKASVEYIKTTFNGKEYDINKNNTTISDLNSCDESIYKIKLNGFSYNDNELSIDVAIGYIKDNTLYNLDDKKISEINDNDIINDMLNNSTIYRYGFKLDNTYYLDNISKVNTIEVSE